MTADAAGGGAVGPLADPSVDLVVGVGSEHGDDAAGLLVARRLRAGGGLLRVLELSGDLTGLADLWQPGDRVAVVDAVRSGAPPGSVRVLDATAAPLPAGLTATSTHGLSVAAAIELARAVRRLPRRLTVYAVEGQSWATGSPPSAAVLAAVERTAAALAAGSPTASGGLGSQGAPRAGVTPAAPAAPGSQGGPERRGVPAGDERPPPADAVGTG